MRATTASVVLENGMRAAAERKPPAWMDITRRSEPTTWTTSAFDDCCYVAAPQVSRRPALRQKSVRPSEIQWGRALPECPKSKITLQPGCLGGSALPALGDLALAAQSAPC